MFVIKSGQFGINLNNVLYWVVDANGKVHLTLTTGNVNLTKEDAEYFLKMVALTNEKGSL